jgi:hypothetical protein
VSLDTRNIRVLRITNNADAVINGLRSAVNTVLETIALEQNYNIHTDLEAKEIKAPSSTNMAA